jgi:hypothetical protein
MYKLGLSASELFPAVMLWRPNPWPRIGLARLAETSIRRVRGKEEGQSLGAFDKILASSIGGALATWNQPIEVIRVEVFIAPFHYDQHSSLFTDAKYVKGGGSLC